MNYSVRLQRIFTWFSVNSQARLISVHYDKQPITFVKCRTNVSWIKKSDVPSFCVSRYWIYEHINSRYHSCSAKLFVFSQPWCRLWFWKFRMPRFIKYHVNGASRRTRLPGMVFMQQDANPGLFSVSSLCKHMDDERVIHLPYKCGGVVWCGVHAGLQI